MKFLEDPLQMVGRNADAGILNVDAQPVLDPAAGDPDVPALGVAQRILDQVAEQAPEQGPVAAHRLGAGLDLPGQPLAGRERSVTGGDLVDQRVDRELGNVRLHHPRVQLRDIEQAVHQCLKGVESALQVRQRLLTSWAVNVALEHAGKQDEGLKGLAQVMTGRSQELRLRQVGALRLLHGAAQRLLRRLPLGDVAGDLSEADQSAGLVPDWINNNAGPEPAAILAHPPAFGFERPVALCHTQRLHRYARGAIRVGVEAGEMLADDFGGAITLQPLRTRIPVRDVPGRIEHEDGVVDDALDQQAKALLTLPQGLLGGLAISDVAGDLSEADQVAGVVPDGIDDDARPEATTVL